MKLITRKQWGAKYAAGFGPRKLPTSQLWMHHTVTLSPDLAFNDLNRDSVDDDEAEAMRTIERIGQQRFGKGFSYNVAGMPSGRLYEGCGVDRIGSHTGGRNTTSFGFVLVGNYETNEVPITLQNAIVDFLRTGHELGWIDRPEFDGGHRDLKETACPGKYAYRLINNLNTLAAAPPVIVPETKKEIDMFIVDDPDDHRQWLCDANTKRHVKDWDEVLGLVYGAEVPHLTEQEGTIARRRAILASRKEVV